MKEHISYTRHPSRSGWLRVAMVGSLLSLPAVAYTYDLPGADFQPGTAISASDVNDKLAALLNAANDLDDKTAKLGDDADFANLTVESIEIATPRTMTFWGDRALRWNDGQSPSLATQCWASINGRPGCIVNNMTGPTNVVMPIDGIPDGTIVEWGMHFGTTNSASPTTWTCDLDYNEATVSSLSFIDDSPGQWNRFISETDLSIKVDNHADGPSQGTGFNSGWRMHCLSDNGDGRFDIHQLYVTYRQG
jgi:hypothetical protein